MSIISSVKWYHVIDGNDVEIDEEESRYTTSRTSAGNNRLVIENSTTREDGQLIVSKVTMDNTVLRIAWSIEVKSEDEHLSRKIEEKTNS